MSVYCLLVTIAALVGVVVLLQRQINQMEREGHEMINRHHDRLDESRQAEHKIFEEWLELVKKKGTPSRCPFCYSDWRTWEQLKPVGKDRGYQ
jgi:hypothetical protein